MFGRSGVALLLVLGMIAAAAAGPEVVNESARQIPVAYQVDVVVVGGGTGAVSAAVAAASAGAKVFLAAPRPYLGDDMTATLRLWLEKGETPVAPLAKAIFNDPIELKPLINPNRISCKYEADQPSAARHKDTSPPSLLTDGAWGNATKESVEYAGDVNLVVDLLKPQQADEVRLMAYQRDSSTNGFKVASITVFTSDDKKTWREVGMAKNDQSEDGGLDPCVILSAPVKAKTRYVRVSVKKDPSATRILLGEVEVSAPGPAVVKQPERPTIPRPMHVKKTLDDALVSAGVEFLYSCYATDVLRDAKGSPCGIVMANRAGRQAVVAKVIVDATDRAVVARQAGVKFRPYPAGVQTFGRVVIGGEPKRGQNSFSAEEPRRPEDASPKKSSDPFSVREILPPFRGAFPNQAKTSSGVFRVLEYTLALPMKDDSVAAFAAADQKARSLTYHPEQQFTSDVLFQIPPDPMFGQETGRDGTAVELLPVTVFRPKGVSRLLVLGGCADVTRKQAEKLLRPLALIDTGARLGAMAAEEAKKLPAPKGVKLAGVQAAQALAPVQGEVRESLTGVRPTQHLPTVPEEGRALPVLGRYDVVVIGGGTAGAPAGIGAARQGAKTLVVEYLSGLGGVGTVGAISSYYWGNRVGFTKEVAGGATSWNIEQKSGWYRDELLKAGADVWFGGVGCGALVDGSHVSGAVVATPQGRGVVLAKVVIDATGNADVAASAGAPCVYTDQGEFAMQGTGLPPRQLGASYTNTDFTITDETDMVDLWHLFVRAKDKYTRAFDQGQLVDTRERRRIAGEFTVSILDQINGRTFPDSIVRAFSNFDSHGYTVDPYLMLEHPMHKGFYTYVPYRCLLPKGLEGMLVAGIGMSVHRDALPLTRMQPDIQNQGYAAGVAAAMAAKDAVPPRRIDIKALQKHLVEVGNLPESVLTDEDSYPMPVEKVAAAVKDFAAGEGKGASVILAQPNEALPLVKAAYQAASGQEKLTYARLLGMMGDATGLDTLLAELERTPAWDAGWDFRGMGQFGHAMSPLDTLIVAIGRTRKPQAVPALVAKLKLLTAESEFSHHRAIALALELIGDSSAAKPLAEHLAKPGMMGYAHTSLARARELDDPKARLRPEETRRTSLRELMVARALYRCGDCEGLGKKTLQQYTEDLRGHLARHAQAVLKQGSPR